MSTTYAIVERTSSASISNNTITQVTSLSQVDASAAGVWNNGAAAFVCPSGADGWYDAWASGVEWSGEQAGPHLIEVNVVRAADGSRERYTLQQVDGDWSTAATTGLVQGGLVAVDLLAGDKVELWVRQISGSTQSLAKVRQFGVRSWA